MEISLKRKRQLGFKGMKFIYGLLHGRSALTLGWFLFEHTAQSGFCINLWKGGNQLKYVQCSWNGHIYTAYVCVHSTKSQTFMTLQSFMYSKLRWCSMALQAWLPLGSRYSAQCKGMSCRRQDPGQRHGE